ncbi:hypothetical protein VUR80DRAFT_4343 [Thermomyces stellatus]
MDAAAAPTPSQNLTSRGSVSPSHRPDLRPIAKIPISNVQHQKAFFLTWPFYRPEKAADSFPTVLNPGLLAKNASPRSCFRYSPANDLEHPPIYPPLGPPSSIGTRVTCRAEVPALNCFLRREHFRDGALVSAPPRFGKWERRCRELGQMLSDSVSGPR